MGVPLAHVWVMFSAPCLTFSSTCSCLCRASRYRALGCSASGRDPEAAGSVCTECGAQEAFTQRPDPPWLPGQRLPEEASESAQGQGQAAGSACRLLSRGGCPDSSLTSRAGQQDAGMQLPQFPVQLLQAAVGGAQQLLHVAQVAAVCGHPPQVLHTLLDFQLLLDGPADQLFLVLWRPWARPGLCKGRGVRPPSAPLHRLRLGVGWGGRSPWCPGRTHRVWEASLTLEPVSLSQTGTPRPLIQPRLLSSATRGEGGELVTFTCCSGLSALQTLPCQS